MSEVDEAIIASLKDLKERQMTTRSESPDEHELFGRHISAVLRCFTPRQQAQARLHIQQILIDIVS